MLSSHMQVSLGTRQWLVLIRVLLGLCLCFLATCRYPSGRGMGWCFFSGFARCFFMLSSHMQVSLGTRQGLVLIRVLLGLCLCFLATCRYPSGRGSGWCLLEFC